MIAFDETELAAVGAKSDKTKIEQILRTLKSVLLQNKLLMERQEKIENVDIKPVLKELENINKRLLKLEMLVNEEESKEEWVFNIQQDSEGMPKTVTAKQIK